MPRSRRLAVRAPGGGPQRSWFTGMFPTGQRLRRACDRARACCCSTQRLTKRCVCRATRPSPPRRSTPRTMSGAARRFMRAVHVFDAAPQKHTPVIASAAAIVSASALGLWYAVRIDHCEPPPGAALALGSRACAGPPPRGGPRRRRLALSRRSRSAALHATADFAPQRHCPLATVPPPPCPRLPAQTRATSRTSPWTTRSPRSSPTSATERASPPDVADGKPERSGKHLLPLMPPPVPCRAPQLAHGLRGALIFSSEATCTASASQGQGLMRLGLDVPGVRPQAAGCA